MEEDTMTFARQHLFSRRGFCLCCIGSATFAATGGWLRPSQVFAEARTIVDLIRSEAAKARGTACILSIISDRLAVALSTMTFDR
jgi:hypothetical protein